MANSSVVAGLLRDVVAADRLTVVLNGTTGLDERVEPAADFLPGEPLVLTVGQLIERKGTADLIDALGRLRSAGRRVHLAVVGEGPLRQALEARAAAEGVADTVHWVGRLEHSRVLAMMARAQLFALPSCGTRPSGSSTRKPWRRVRPCSPYRAEDLQDFVESGESGGWLVPAHDPGAIAEVVAQVLDDPGRAAVIGAAGRATARGLSWERNAGMTLDVYRRVLQGR